MQGYQVKNIILAATALVSATALTTAARAADIAPAAYDWSGFYFGVNAGVAWNNSEIDNEVNGLLSGLAEELGDDLTGDDAVFTGGAMLGYNWQMDSIVLGVEADINYLGFSGEQNREGAIEVGGGYYQRSELSFDADWFGTLRGRLGFAADNILFYGTGGLAYGHMDASSDVRLYNSSSDPTVIGRWEGSADDVNWGWTIGAGMEYGIDNWSLGVEYLYVDLGDADWEADDSAFTNSIGQGSSEGSVDYQFSVVRATAKLRF
jgi:outer membrane immunogenic protein